MKQHNRKPSGRPRKNDTSSPVIVDRAKLRRLKDVVNEIMTDYNLSTHRLAEYTIGSRGAYISAISRGRHLAHPPEVRPREDEYDSILRFRSFLISQNGVSGEVSLLMFERFGLLGRVAYIDNRIYKALNRLAMKEYK